MPTPVPSLSCPCWLPWWCDFGDNSIALIHKPRISLNPAQFSKSGAEDDASICQTPRAGWPQPADSSCPGSSPTGLEPRLLPCLGTELPSHLAELVAAVRVRGPQRGWERMWLSFPDLVMRLGGSHSYPTGGGLCRP